MADNTTGTMLGWIQDCVVDGYRDGGLLKDKGLTLHYYTLAVQNGSTSAKTILELYKTHPEILG